MLEVSAVHLHACTKTLVPLVNALSMMLWWTLTCCRAYTLFQFVSVVHPRLVHSLLDDAPDAAINQIKVRAVCWPKIRWNECRRCSRSHTVSRAGVLGRCPVERRKISLIPRASRGEAVLTVVSAIDLNTRVDEDEVCAAHTICRQTP